MKEDGFSRAIGADDCQRTSFCNLEAQIREDFDVLKTDRQPIDFKHVVQSSSPYSDIRPAHFFSLGGKCSNIFCATRRMAAFMDFLSNPQLLASDSMHGLHCLSKDLTSLEEVLPRVGTRKELFEIAQVETRWIERGFHIRPAERHREGRLVAAA